MMRLCVIWILCCSHLCCSASDTPLSIDYSCQQQTFDTVLDHLERFADIQSSIDTELLDEDILKTKIDLHLRGADYHTCLQAICHALQRKMWWHLDDEYNVQFTRTLAVAHHSKTQTRIYHSNTTFPKKADHILRKFMQPWLAYPQSGIGFIPQQTQWAANLNTPGHHQIKKVLLLFERQQQEFPVLINPHLKRVLPISESIQCESWSTAALALQKQLKCSVSLDHRLSNITDTIKIRACIPENLITVIASNGQHAAWINQCLCISSEPVQSWQHPLHVQACSFPLDAIAEDQRAATVNKIKRLMAKTYWQQPGCVMEYVSERNSCFLSAHPSVIAIISAAFQQIDSSTNKR